MDVIVTPLGADLEVKHVFHAKPSKDGNQIIYVRFYAIQKTIRVYESLISTAITK